MPKEITEKNISQGLKDFQLFHEDFYKGISVEDIEHLACCLHDDIPLGYEGSLRLGTGLLDIAKALKTRDRVIEFLTYR